MAFRVHTIFIVHKTVIVYTFSFDLRRTHRRLGTNGQACCATEPKREHLGFLLFSCWVWVEKNAWRNWCVDTMAKGRDGGLHGVVVEKCFCFGVCLMWWDFCGFGSHSIMHNILNR